MSKGLQGDSPSVNGYDPVSHISRESFSRRLIKASFPPGLFPSLE